jgi:hypothetical protein
MLRSHTIVHAKSFRIEPIINKLGSEAGVRKSDLEK